MKNLVKKLSFGMAVLALVGVIALNIPPQIEKAHATTPVKAIVYKLEPNGSFLFVNVAYIDPSINTVTEDAQFMFHFGNSFGAYDDLLNYGTTDEIKTVVLAKVSSYAITQGYSISISDITVEGMATLTPNELTAVKTATQPRSFNYAPGRSIVTGTGATGFQVSSTRDAMVSYSTKITTTATIAGGQEGYVVLEIAPTNSATAGDWKEVARVTNGQALSLALTLQSIQPISGSLSAMVPAGYYVKVRSVNTTGTPSYSMVSGQEVLE